MGKNRMYIFLLLALLVAGVIFYEAFLPDLQARYHQQQLQQQVDLLLSEMTLEEKVGQMIFPAFNGRSLNLELEKLLTQVQPGGLIFFPYNLSGLAGSQNFIQNLQQASKVPLFIAIDQEGGLIQKLQEGVPEVNDYPGAMAIGAAGSETLSYELARAMGAELRTVGFNMVFAPDLDVNSNPDNPVIGIRSFGSNPQEVADLGVAFMDGLTRAGVIPVGKHFPGHGDTAADTHLGTAMLPYEKRRLEKLELVPFKEAIANGIPALMSAHVTIPKLVPSNRPATLAPEILTDLLRTELGYDGLIITDAMNMKAISSHFGKEESVVQAVQAGADLILMPIAPDRAHQAVVEAVRSGKITAERIDQSVERILLLKVSKGFFQQTEEEQAAGLKSHGREIAQDVADQAVTLVQDHEGLIPLRLQADQKLVVITPIQSVTQTYLDELKKVYSDQQITGLTVKNLSLTPAQWQWLQTNADWVLVATNSRTPSTRRASHPQMQTVAKLWQQKPGRMIWVSLQTPYELSTFPEISPYLAQYGYNLVNSRAMIRLITGQVEPTGQLPVALPQK